MNKTTNTIIGILLAVISSGILIYAFETERSFIQIITAFVLLILPISFLSSINGKLAVFIFSIIIIGGGYLCYKQIWYDTLYGVGLAILLGGATHFYKISRAETFSATDYKTNRRKKINNE